MESRGRQRVQASFHTRNEPMSLISPISSASLGIQQELRQFSEAAARLSHQPADSEVVSDVAQMKLAERRISYNAQVMRTADQILGLVLDTFV